MQHVDLQADAIEVRKRQQAAADSCIRILVQVADHGTSSSPDRKRWYMTHDTSDDRTSYIVHPITHIKLSNSNQLVGSVHSYSNPARARLFSHLITLSLVCISMHKELK